MARTLHCPTLVRANGPTELDMKRLLPALTFVSTFAFAATAYAAAPPDDSTIPEGAGGIDAATSGSTDIDDGEGFKKAAGTQEENEADDATELVISAGGIYSTGNARNLAITGNGTFRLRREIHQFSAAVAGNYGMADIDPAEAGLEENVRNVQGRVRYDVFFHPRWSAFAMVTGRHDVFQGLDLRLNVDPGVAFYALKGPKHRLWFEAGYDFQFDARSIEGRQIDLDEDGDFEPDTSTDYLEAPTRVNHAARLFAGYAYRLDERITFDLGLEYLQSFLKATWVRINFDAGTTIALTERFSLGATFQLRWDNDPLPNVQKLDTITAINLVFKLI